MMIGLKINLYLSLILFVSRILLFIATVANSYWFFATVVCSFFELYAFSLPIGQKILKLLKFKAIVLILKYFHKEGWSKFMQELLCFCSSVYRLSLIPDS